MSFSGPFIFRINDNGSGPNLLLQVCLERGWREYSEAGLMRDNWHLWWRSSSFPLSQHKQLKTWQFTNHIPKASAICRKDNLSRYLKYMKKVFGAIYDFSPEAYNLPLEYTKLVAECSRLQYGHLEEGGTVWICKPVGQSQGRGISLFRKLSDLAYDSNAVVQRYVKNPLLIGGYKFDLRLYVCVPCFHPLTIYLYREGLARFSTDKFSLRDLDNPYAHLTNSSLNKLGPGYTEMKDRVGAGCKWSLKQLRHYLHQSGINDWLLWHRISSLIVLTVVSQLSGIPSSTNCFEFYGFDVLIDASLRPWLLEVNVSPALGNDCDVDPAVKKPLLHDLFDLLGLPVCNTGLSLFTLWSGEEWQEDEEGLGSAREQGVGRHRVDGSLRHSRTLNVVTAASRWKRLHTEPQPHKVCKKSGNIGRKTPSRSASADPMAASAEMKERPSSARARPTRTRAILSTLTINGQSLGNQDEVFGMGARARGRDHPKSLWGNGRDWSTPVESEGDWVRVYPISCCDSSREDNQSPLLSDKEVRMVVSNINRYSKVAKDVFKKSADLSDELRNHLLLRNYGNSSGTVWMPRTKNEKM